MKGARRRSLLQGSLLKAFLHPVPQETKQNLKRIAQRFPEAAQGRRQMIGRHAEGCSALIGAMPRCDFACTGCYLGSSANRTPRASREELLAQLRTLRKEVGRHGNLQLTDGELTLLPEEELIELVKLAKEEELTPMLMTHGDVLRKKPEFLERLMLEGGLEEISFHIDSTQRGRRGSEYKNARSEEALMSLRDEFAALVRRVRARTGKTLRVATTITVTEANVDEVPSIVAWHLRNADAFRILTFLPMAQVGRTQARRGAVTVDELWARIAEGMGEERAQQEVEHGRLHFGHPACSRVVLGLASAGRFRALRLDSDPSSTRPFDGFIERFGGLMLRGDSRPVAAARVAGLLVRAPLFFATRIPAYAVHWVKRWSSPGGRLAFLRDVLLGRRRFHGLSIVSHHFMDARELETDLGRERLAACVFHVAPNGEKVSMCATNASELRDRYYRDLRGEPTADESSPSPTRFQTS